MLLALSLFLSRNRRRMVIYLAIGTFVAFLIARFAIRTMEDVLVSGIANLGVAGMVRAVMDATFEDLRGLTLLVARSAWPIVGIVAYLTGKPAWVSTATDGRHLGGEQRGQSLARRRAGTGRGRAAAPALRLAAPRPAPRRPDARGANGLGHADHQGRSAAGALRPRTGAPSFSIRMAVALNSAVPDFGSVASMVSRLTATSSWKCMRHERQARAAATRRSGPGTSTWPRRETTRTTSPSARP